MAWNKPLEAAANDKGDVRLSVVVTSKGKSRLVIMLSPTVMEQVGDPDNCNAWLGEGEDKGKVLVQFDADGSIPVKGFSRGGASLRLLLPVSFEQQKQRALVCQHEVMDSEEDVKQLLVVLPPAIARLQKAAA